MTQTLRVSAGVPTGGQFAAHRHGEAAVDLNDDGGGVSESAEWGAGSDAVEADPRCADCGQFTSPGREHICGSRVMLASRLADLDKKIAAANKKLERNGLAERFEIEILGQRTETRTAADGSQYSRDLIDYRLNKPEVKIGDWEFVGRLDVLADGTPIAVTKPGAELGGYRPTEQRCDHCGTLRARKSTYLLRDSSGDVKQVGSNCLEAFTGIEPRGLWSLEWDPDVDIKEADDEPGSYGSGGWERSASPEEILTMALAVTDEGRSYVSRSNAEMYGRYATSGVVTTYLWPDQHTRDSEEYRQAVAAIRSDEIKEMAAEVLDFAKMMEGESDYAANMRDIARQEAITPRHIGMLASAVSGWRRSKEKQVKEAIAKANPPRDAYLAPVGERVRRVPATVTKALYLDSFYGTKTMLIFRDNDGHELKWMASSAMDFNEGDKVMIQAATVKEHGEWNGTKQTVLTRAKLEEAV